MSDKENKQKETGISSPYDNHHCLNDKIRKEGPVQK